MTGAVLSVTDVTVRFGGATAVDRVSAHVEPGEIVGLIGPNGAGKSTLINAISALVPHTGSVAIGGTEVTRQRAYQRSRHGIGRAFQRVAFASGITARDHLGAAALHGRLLRRRALDAEQLRLVEAAGLTPYLDVPVDGLSFLHRRLVGILMAVIAGERIVMLDEATAGLTDGERQRIGAMILGWAEAGRGFLVVEHDLEFVQQIASRTVVMDHGAVIADGPTADVLRDPAVVTAYMGD